MAKDLKTNQSFNWKIAAKAGEGVMVSAKIMALAAKRHGLKVFNYLEYPSLIKGGHQTGQVYASRDNASCQKRQLDVLIAYDKESINIHQIELSKDSIVIVNSESEKVTDKIIEIPISQLAVDSAGSKIAANTVVLGISAYLLGLDQQVFNKILKEEFASKGDAVINSNLEAFKAGFEKASELTIPIRQIQKTKDNQVLMTGNEAIGLGAIAGGIQYYSTYPMTPASALIHYLADQQKNYPLIVKHTEDEIAGINQAIGASFAGVRAMTGSSGGGFALMVEGLSLAGVTEIPLVVLEGQRPGPATGLPTWTSQADLQFVLSAGHGEFPKVLLSPGTIEEHFKLTKLAFYLAEKYQVLVIIISDKYSLESHQTMIEPKSTYAHKVESQVRDKDLKTDDSFNRYSLAVKDGVSLRSVPGQAHGLYIANSYEHDEKGFATEESIMTVDQTEKRMKKLAAILTETPKPYLIGNKKAKVTFVGWGSTILVMKEVIQQTDKVNYIHLPCLWPFDSEVFLSLIKTAQKTVMIEGNSTGQAEQLIRQETGHQFSGHLRRFDGRPFYSEDILAWIEKK